MLFPLVGLMLLLLLLPPALHSTGAAESQGGTEMPQRLEQIVASPGDTVEILCRCPAGVYMYSVTWYKEEGQDRALSKIHEISRLSRPQAQGRYSGNYAGEMFNLTISRLQKNDSGVYYCIASTGGSFRVINGSRVIVTGGAKPTPAILGPSSLEGAPLNHSRPLLCLILGADPAWATVFWNIGGAASQDPWTGDAIDGGGVFGLWSLQLVPPESWAPGASYTCSVPGSRNVSAAFLWGAESTHTGNCVHILYWGVLPCTLILLLLLLLITLLVLLLRKMPARGNAAAAAHPEAQVRRRRETPATEYAALGCKQ